jgi:murein DD-endopeptidase MepM/ murein hydrolase activator NlpD
VTAIAGAPVRKGDKIAEVGATGQATGPHLHFALQREGIYLNPIYYLVG